MAARCGSLWLPLLPSTRSSVLSSLPSSGTSPVAVGFLLSHGKRASAKGGEKASASSPAKAYLVVEDVQQQNKGPVGALGGLAADAARAVLGVLQAVAAGRRNWALQAEKTVERTVINSRFFTLIAVAGTLIGSILCFVEGCFLVAEAFFEYFHAVWEKLGHGEVMGLLIEATDMFLVGSAMLNLGMGMYVMFTGSKGTPRFKGWLIPRSNVPSIFHQKVMLPSSMEMRCISEAKAKLGHAVLMLLQSGVVDKFKDVPLTSGMDLACLAGAILVSSAGVFLLSRLHEKPVKLDDKSVGVS